MSSIAPFDPIFPGEYRWKSSPDSQKLWRRPLANEAMWCERPKDSRDLFVYASLTFKFPIVRNTLSKAIGAAWQRLLHDVPALVLMTGTDPKDGKRCILYQSPQNQEEVNQRAVRTSAFAFGAEQQSFEDLRSRVLSKKRSNHADNVYLFSHARFAAESLILVSGLQVMIYLDHLVTVSLHSISIMFLLLQSSRFVQCDGLVPRGCGRDYISISRYTVLSNTDLILCDLGWHRCPNFAWTISLTLVFHDFHTHTIQIRVARKP